MPSGRFSQNAHRQPGPSVSQPPSSGPATEETANTAPMRPMYLPRSRAGTTSAIAACDRMIRPPPPRPCTTRATMRTSMLPARAPMTEPAMNSTIAAISTGLRPNRSLMPPVDRHRDRRGEDVPGDHPGHGADAVELADDGRQGRRQHGLVQRCQQHRDHQAAEQQREVVLRLGRRDRRRQGGGGHEISWRTCAEHRDGGLDRLGAWAGGAVGLAQVREAQDGDGEHEQRARRRRRPAATTRPRRRRDRSSSAVAIRPSAADEVLRQALLERGELGSSACRARPTGSSTWRVDRTIATTSRSASANVSSPDVRQEPFERVLGHHGGRRAEQRVLLGGVVVEERAARDAGAVGDRLDGRGGEAALAGEVHRGRRAGRAASGVAGGPGVRVWSAAFVQSYTSARSPHANDRGPPLALSGREC